MEDRSWISRILKPIIFWASLGLIWTIFIGLIGFIAWLGLVIFLGVIAYRISGVPVVEANGKTMLLFMLSTLAGVQGLMLLFPIIVFAFLAQTVLNKIDNRNQSNII